MTGHQPEESGGYPLPGTEDARCQGDTVMGFSPDTNWLVYESRDGDLLNPVFVFYELKQQERRVTTLSDQAAKLSRQGRGPTLPACWSQDSMIAFFPGHSIWYAARVGDRDFELKQVDEPDCTTRPEPRLPGAEVKKISPSKLQIEGRGGVVLAEHMAQGVAKSRIEATHLRPSPDGRWLAYVVTEYRDSFTAPPQGYLIELAPESTEPPQFLAAPVFGPPTWAPTGEVYVCSGRPDSSPAEPRILRWETPMNSNPSQGGPSP